jgi:hypothetical protein
MQSAITVGVQSKSVSKKDFCVLSLDNTRVLKDIKFAINSSDKNTYEKLDQLHSVVETVGILTLIKSQRTVPLITVLNPLGYRESMVIYRLLSSMSDMSKNQFLDEKGVFNPKTWKRPIALMADDMVCYQNDINVLKSVIRTVFDDQLQLFALPLLKADKIVEAFQALILKVRGTQQVDIDLARDNLREFTTFDMSVEINIGMNTLVKLIAAVNYATGIPLTEDELTRKFHECFFNDNRLVMHNYVLDSMARKHTYQESVDRLYTVMELLPLEKRRITAPVNMDNSITSKNVGNNGQQRKLFCYPFQFDSCSDRDCQLRHEIVAEAAKKADLCSSELGEDNECARGQDTSLKKLDVDLSIADREYFGVSNGQTLDNNSDGLSARKGHSINAVIASNHLKSTMPYGGHNINFSRGDHQYDQSTDQLYDQYVSEFDT